MYLKTKRLFLREFVFEDWTAVYAYQSDPLYLRYYDWIERSEADVREFVQVFLDWQRERPRTKFQLAIIHLADNRLIGNCGIRVNNQAQREANIGYELDSRYWDQGYATEAARAILQFGFAELNMQRIWAKCVAENVGSARVLEKIGMRLEARELKKEFIKDAWRDHLIFAINAHNWLG
ncbi:MAG: GNAT family N-acetyltransferase [Anaerolineae bacterium]|jgi:[ribosomal protein S5]-alanine N-acetyltransferase